LENISFQKGHTNLIRKSTQEPFYIVTEAEETPVAETVQTEPTSPETSLETPAKQKVTRNISEPLIGLQVGSTVTQTLLLL